VAEQSLTSRDALPFYRVMAYVTGVMLLVLCAAIYVRYGPADDPAMSEVVSPIHGWLYVIYLVSVVLLVRQRQWTPGRIVLIALAGTVPFASFFAERYVVKHAQRASVDQ
jgi:integral membrane protein